MELILLNSNLPSTLKTREDVLQQLQPLFHIRKMIVIDREVVGYKLPLCIVNEERANLTPEEKRREEMKVTVE